MVFIFSLMDISDALAGFLVRMYCLTLVFIDLSQFSINLFHIYKHFMFDVYDFLKWNFKIHNMIGMYFSHNNQIREQY